MEKWRHWHYKNTFLLVLSIFIFFLLAETPQLKAVIRFIGEFGYLGALFSGVFFVSVFTVAPASLLIFHFSELLNPLIVACIAGLGAVIGDYLIFRFLKDRVFEELTPFYMAHGGRKIHKLFKTPYFAWLLPIAGAFIIISPFPDEAGITMMGCSKIKTWQFLILTFLLNSVGILLIVLTAKTF